MYSTTNNDGVSVFRNVEEKMTMKPIYWMINNNYRPYRSITVLAYIPHGGDCGEMFVEESIVDRDLGDSSMDPVVKAFVNKYISDNKCQC